MKKSEIFNLVIDEVCEECEVRRDCVIDGNRMQSVVDARILAVQYLRRLGLSSDDIALFVLREIDGDPTLCPDIKDLKSKARSVNKMFNSYSARCLESASFRSMSLDIKHFFLNEHGDLCVSWPKDC